MRNLKELYEYNLERIKGYLIDSNQNLRKIGWVIFQQRTK